MTTNDNKNLLKNLPRFYCEQCNYGTGKKSSFSEHLLTAKHLKTTIDNQNLPKTCSIKHQCENCEKKYNDRAGLWRHNQKYHKHVQNEQINLGIETQNNEIQELKEFMKYFMKENSEMKNMMMEVIKNGTHNTINNNSNNKSFNLHFFLNETCKDAMNIMDFVESIQLQLSDLEKVGEIGYVDGISNIIVKNLKALDVTQRPVHCTDKKREVLYVKDENKWEKQDEDNVKFRKVIKKVTDKNMTLIPKYREKYPDCNKSISRYSDQYNKIIVESMGG